MKSISTLLLLGLLGLTRIAHAEGGCPPGMIPYSGTDISSCGPIPNYNQNSDQQQLAPPPRWATRWGSIVIDYAKTNVGIGVSTNVETKELAEDIALQDCRAKGGTECKVNLTYHNQCVVVAAGFNYGNAQGAATIREASQLGLKDCRDAGASSCQIYYSACSLPERIQ